jgi:hypothetical protein
VPPPPNTPSPRAASVGRPVSVWNGGRLRAA